MVILVVMVLVVVVGRIYGDIGGIGERQLVVNINNELFLYLKI